LGFQSNVKISAADGLMFDTGFPCFWETVVP